MKKHNFSQRSPEWQQIRKGKISGTFLKNILGTPRARQEAVYEFIADKLTVGIDLGEENAMDRGIRLEADAIAMFELETGKKVETIGFCEHDDEPIISNSPDGYVADSNDTEAVEAKCLGGKNHVKMWLTNRVPDDYEWQVIQYFVVNPKLKKLYFVGYNPDIPSHSLHIIQVNREEVTDRIEIAYKAQVEFIKEVNQALGSLIEEI